MARVDEEREGGEALLKDDQVDLECLGLPRLQLRYSFHLKRIRSLPFRADRKSVV